MHYNSLFKLLWANNQEYQQAIKNILDYKSNDITGLTHYAQNILLAGFATDSAINTRPIIYLVNQYNPVKINKLIQDIKSFNSEIPVHALLLSELYQLDNIRLTSDKLAILSSFFHALKSQQTGVYIIPTELLLEALPLPNNIQELILHKSNNYNLNDITSQLIDMGYTKVSNVTNIGEFALRGDILDIYSNNTQAKLPYRLGFFDNELESIKHFEPQSQRSIHSQVLDTINIHTINFFHNIIHSYDINNLNILMNNITSNDQVFWEDDINNYYEIGWCRFIPWLLHNNIGSIWDYCTGNEIFIYNDLSNIHNILEQAYNRKSDQVNKLKLKIASSKFIEQFRIYIHSPYNEIKNLQSRLYCNIL